MRQDSVRKFFLSSWNSIHLNLQMCCCLIFLFATEILFAQPIQQQSYVASPSTAAMVKAGNVPLNLSAGVLDHSINVYDIATDDFNWPIKLQYSYPGLKLEELSGECGLGWSMSGLGGIVTREVRGLPDEHPRGFYGSQNRRQYVEQAQSLSDLPLSITQDFVSGLYDAEPDKFIVSAGELSFSFFINAVDCETCPLKDQKVTVTSNAELAKVTFNWDAIEITDAGGNVFRFQEKETSTFYSPDLYNQEKMQNYTSAWHLTSITVPTGRQIRFSYSSRLIQQIHHSETFDRTAAPLGENIRVDCAALGGNNNSGFNQELFVREISHQQYWSNSEIQTPYLDNIQWDYGNQIEILRTQSAMEYELPLISSVIVKNSNGKTVKSINLNYETEARSLLTQVRINSDEIYDFDYFPVTIPAVHTPLTGNISDPLQNPYAQDFWGFANGKGNPSAIPELGGDRRPDFRTTLQGALHTISWPAGGTTTIDYEPNQIRLSAVEFLEQEPEASNREFTFAIQSSQNRPASSSKSIVFDKVTFARISHQAYIKGTSTQLNVDFQPAGGCTGKNCQTYYTYAEQMRSIYPDQAPRFYPAFGIALTGDVIMQGCDGFQACQREAVSRWIRIEPGIYQVEASLSNAEFGLFQMTIEFFDPDPENKSPQYYDISAAGMRVKRTKDCPDPGSEAGCMQKIYRYKSEDGYSSGTYLSRLDQEFMYQVYDAVDCRQSSADPGAGGLPLFFEWNYPAVRKSFRSYNPLVFYSGSPIYYSRVEILDDPNVSYGREVRAYRPSAYGLSGSYPYTPLPRDENHGVVWKTEWLSSKDSVVRDLITEYQVSGTSSTEKSPDGMVFGLSKSYRYTPLLSQSQLDELRRSSILFRKYSAEQSVRRLMISETDRDRSGLNQKKFYRYNLRLQLAADSMVNSDGISIVNRYSYSPDFSDAENKKLETLNRIAQPVSVSKWVNGIQRERRNTIYKDWSGDRKMVHPLRMDVIKDGASLTELVYEQYGSGNKPITWTQRDGIQKVLIWDSRQDQLKAEVTGAKPQEVFFTSFEFEDPAGNSVPGDSHSGEKSFTGNFQQELSGLDLGKSYRLSWFEKDQDGKWLPRSRVVNADPTGKFLIRLMGQIDDIRFHPVSAQMRSFTSDPLIGITSETDPGLRTTYYEYDQTGRLVTIRDSDKNIISKTSYQYGKQP